jgi:DNA-directed RNA polymerase specialized sigma24 family protein
MQDGAGLSDAQLLEMFISQKDQAAFEAIVRRYGSMVLKVCHRVIRNHHDAEDACQATFLLMARKASSIKSRDRVANWLHGVAFRTALYARKLSLAKWGRERQVANFCRGLNDSAFGFGTRSYFQARQHKESQADHCPLSVWECGAEEVLHLHAGRRRPDNLSSTW